MPLFACYALEIIGPSDAVVGQSASDSIIEMVRIELGGELTPGESASVRLGCGIWQEVVLGSGTHVVACNPPDVFCVVEVRERAKERA